ncbi:MAG: hypothetical protein K6F35_00575 [Lachnospiraceae bacterium]|nr:hypothetical protein [Lachnospiraceae bacterium]
MEYLILIKENIRIFYSRYEGYITAVLKFALCFVVLVLINGKMGYMKRLDSMPVVLIVSLLCSFLPANLIVFFSAVFVVLHTYALSLECAVVMGALFFLMFLLYYRYSPKDTPAVLLTPVSFAMGIPYAMPIVYGLVGTILSFLSVSCGVIAYYMVEYINSIADTVQGMADDTTVARFRFVVDGILHNKEMVVMVVSFTAALVVVSLIRHFSFPHSWDVALASGILVDMIAVVVTSSVLGVKVNLAGLFLGNIIAALIGIVVRFFVFSVDYTRTERVQFEDDEYYYYVKAVPKNTIQPRETREENSKPVKIRD